MRKVLVLGICHALGVFVGSCETNLPHRGQPTSVWSSMDGDTARTRHGTAVPAARPELAWSRTLRDGAGHYISVALGDEKRLYLVCGVKRGPEQVRGRERVYVVGVALSDGQEVWRFEPPGLRGYEWRTTTFAKRGPVALGGGRLFLPSLDGLAVIDGRTGALLTQVSKNWRIVEFPEGIWGTRCRYPRSMIVQASRRRVYLAGKEGKVRSLSLPDGELLWETEVLRGGDDWDDYVMELAMAEEKLVVVGVDRSAGLAVLKTEDGTVLWRKKQLPRAALFAQSGPGSPAVAGGRILLPILEASVLSRSAKSYLVAFDLASGRLLWRTRLSAFPIRSTASDGQRAFVVDVENNVTCIELSRGRRLWERKGAWSEAGAVVCGDLILVLSEKGVLQALSSESGEVRWKFEVNERAGQFDQVLPVGGRILLVGPSVLLALGFPEQGKGNKPGQPRPGSLTTTPCRRGMEQ